MSPILDTPLSLVPVVATLGLLVGFKGQGNQPQTLRRMAPKKTLGARGAAINSPEHVAAPFRQLERDAEQSLFALVARAYRR